MKEDTTTAAKIDKKAINSTKIRVNAYAGRIAEAGSIITKFIGKRSEDRCKEIIRAVRDERKAEVKESGKLCKDDQFYNDLRSFESAVNKRFADMAKKGRVERVYTPRDPVAPDTDCESGSDHETTAGEAPTFNSLAGILKAMKEGGATPSEIKRDMMKAWAIVNPDIAFLGLE